MSSLNNLENQPNIPASGGRPLKKARLMDRIAAVAGDLFHAHGYTAVTMEQIAMAAEVSKRTLYKYFSVKEAMLAHLLETELARDLAGPGVHFDLDAPFRTNILAVLAESAAWCERHPDYLLPYIRYKFASFEPNTETASNGDLVKTWTLLIAKAQQDGDLDSTHPAEQLAIYFHYLYLGALMRWITDQRLDLKQEFSLVVRLFVDGTSVAS
jgi:AcrR family transcriptional regulator